MAKLETKIQVDLLNIGVFSDTAKLLLEVYVDLVDLRDSMPVCSNRRLVVEEVLGRMERGMCRIVQSTQDLHKAPRLLNELARRPGAINKE